MYLSLIITNMKKVIVEYVIQIPILYPDSWNEDDIVFDVEENHCIATGKVGLALEELKHTSDKDGVCWACKTEQRDPRIISISFIPETTPIIE